MILVSTARYMGTFPHVRTPSYVIVGQDGGQSIALKKGTLFLFSDTLLICADQKIAAMRPDAPLPVPKELQSAFLANCAAITTSDFPDLLQAVQSLRYFHDVDGLPKEILTPSHRERFRRLRFWPEHGILLGEKVYFYYLGVQTTDPSSIWGFRTLGAGIASLDVNSGESTRLQNRGDWLFWRAREEDLHFGVQVLQHEGLLYVFGSLRRGAQSYGLLARVKPEQIGDLQSYQYLVGDGPFWTPDFERAGTLGACGAEYSVSYNSYLQCYAMIYLDEYRKRLLMRTADQVWGPYSAPIDLIGVPHQETSLLAYLGFEHAHFQQGGGRRIYVSYCEPYFASTSLITLTLAYQGATAKAGF